MKVLFSSNGTPSTVTVWPVFRASITTYSPLRVVDGWVDYAKTGLKWNVGGGICVYQVRKRPVSRCTKSDLR
jgi:hypothetical protein